MWKNEKANVTKEICCMFSDALQFSHSSDISQKSISNTSSGIDFQTPHSRYIFSAEVLLILFLPNIFAHEINLRRNFYRYCLDAAPEQPVFSDQPQNALADLIKYIFADLIKYVFWVLMQYIGINQRKKNIDKQTKKCLRRFD